MGVLDNYVRLEEGVPKLLRFIDHYIMPKEITDPVTGRIKTINTLVFSVIEEDRRKVRKEFSVTAEKLAMLFEPYLEEKKYLGKLFQVTMYGKGFARKYNLVVI